MAVSENSGPFIRLTVCNNLITVLTYCISSIAKLKFSELKQIEDWKTNLGLDLDIDKLVAACIRSILPSCFNAGAIESSVFLGIVSYVSLLGQSNQN